MDYKDVKLEFVSGHTGTSLIEIAIVVSSAPVGLLARNELKSFIQVKGFWSSFILDNVCLGVPGLLCFTVLCDAAKQIVGTLLLGIGLLLLYHLSVSTKAKDGCAYKEGLGSFLKIPMSGKRSFISAFRANVNLATALSILAVDFVIFPRRFCKAETYGTGLMDVGVGAYVISNAIVSPEARDKYPAARGLMANFAIVFKSIKICAPLVILGIGRTLSVKSVDYQEHVSEYGVHWNFFFTLACVRVLSSLVLCFFPHSVSWLLALCIGMGFQYLLDGPVGLKQFALHGFRGEDTRQGILEANREGLVSCLGYLAIYFAGIHMGKYLLRKRSTVSEWVWVLVTLVSADVIAWICLYVVNLYEPVSRRLANLPFIIWMVAYCLQLLASFLLVDIIDVVMTNLSKETNSDKEEVSVCLLEAVNYNGLFYFLLANVMTGIVNLSFPTVYMSSVAALVIVTFYMGFLACVMYFLYAKKISLKFW